MKMNGQIIKTWSSPLKAKKALRYSRDQIEKVLSGANESYKDYKWRYLTLQEMCDNVPKSLRET